VKSDRLAELVWRFDEAADGFEESSDFIVVLFEACLQFGKFSRELLVGSEQFTQLDEGTHNIKAGLDGSVSVEDTGDHNGVVLGESIRAEASSAAFAL